MLTLPSDKETNINPSCLKVDNATTFLASVSMSAAKLATLSVIIPIKLHNTVLIAIFRPKRIISQIPAVTNVEL
jgi:hypothetical protein